MLERKRRWLESQAHAALVDDDDGDDDFTAEERAAKKLKRGAISAQDFDQTFFENL